MPTIFTADGTYLTTGDPDLFAHRAFAGMRRGRGREVGEHGIEVVHPWGRARAEGPHIVIHDGFPGYDRRPMQYHHHHGHHIHGGPNIFGRVGNLRVDGAYNAARPRGGGAAQQRHRHQQPVVWFDEWPAADWFGEDEDDDGGNVHFFNPRQHRNRALGPEWYAMAPGHRANRIEGPEFEMRRLMGNDDGGEEFVLPARRNRDLAPVGAGNGYWYL